MSHGLATSYSATVIECTCGQTLIVRGAEGIQQFLEAHAQGSKPLNRESDHKAHRENLGRIRIFKEEK